MNEDITLARTAAIAYFLSLASLAVGEGDDPAATASGITKALRVLGATDEEVCAGVALASAIMED